VPGKSDPEPTHFVGLAQLTGTYSSSADETKKIKWKNKKCEKKPLQTGANSLDDCAATL